MSDTDSPTPGPRLPWHHVEARRSLSLHVLVTWLMLLATAAVVAAVEAPPPTGTLRVEVIDASGAAVPGAILLVERLGGAPIELPWIAADGIYRAESLPAGRYVLRVVRDGFDAVEREVIVPAAGELRVSVRIQPASLSERVTVEGAVTRVDDTATRLATSLQDTPRSLTVIGAERLKEQNIRSVSDALAYVPGMSVNSYRTGSYHFYSRGYRMGPEDTRVDGFVGLNAGGRYGGSMFGVEDVVFLRGPAGIFYGSTGSPGGLVNLITKKPQATPVTTIDVRARGYAGQGIGLADRTSGGIDLDSTGPVGGSRRLLYRVLATAERMEYFTNGVDDRNRYAAASLRIGLDRGGRHLLTPLAQWTRFNRPHGGGLVVSPSTSLSTADGVSGPINRADLSPRFVNHSSGGGIDEVWQAGADARGSFGDRLRYSAAYRFVGNDTSIDQFSPQVNVALLRSAGLLPRVHTRSRTEREYHNYDGNAVYELKTSGAWRTLVQAGVTGRVAGTRATSPLGPAPGSQSPIDIYTGIAATPLVPNYPDIAFGDRTRSSYWTGYAQSQTTLADGRWIVTLGVGYGENRLAAGQPARRSDVMPNAGVVFRLAPDTSIYASYATSYNPADPSAEDREGRQGPFDPTRGTNTEVGVKFGTRRAAWAVAAFHNEIDNALVQSAAGDLNPNGNRYFVAAGTRRSRGLELSGELTPIADLRVTGSLTYLDAIYTGNGPASAASTLAIPGSRAEKSPEWAWSVWTRYTRSRGRLDGLGAALGIVWQADRLGSNGARTLAAPDPLQLPAFTRIDTAVFYRLGARTTIGLNVENLLDELIFVNASVGSSIEVAAPRTVSLRLGYRF